MSKKSATMSGYTSISIHSNHMEMTKFQSSDDPGFESIAEELRRWVKKLQTTPGK